MSEAEITHSLLPCQIRLPKALSKMRGLQLV